MKAKTLITIVLLAFVGVSVVYLVIKESGGKSTTPVTPQTSDRSTAAITVLQVPTESEQKTDIQPSQTADREKGSQNSVISEKKVIQRKVVSYYFHGNMRCMTCRTIEAYTKEAIDTKFTEALKDGHLEWQVINVDESGNEHFVKDFQLVTRSVVIAEIVDGKRTRWKNLQRVWDLVRNKPAFLKYIQDETRAYLEDSGQ
jgi:hypothetical protein